MDWLTAAGNGPFVIALLVMLGLALVELIALVTGSSVNDVVDDFVVSHTGLGASEGNAVEATSAETPGPIGRFLAWLHIGKVPVLMVLILFLSSFGLIGLGLQESLRLLLGFALPPLIAAPVIFLVCLTPVRWLSGQLSRVMPKDETSAIQLDQLTGRMATVVGGTARARLPAQARVRDAFGTDHYVLVEPENADEQFSTGSMVLLVRQISPGRFGIINNPNPALVDGT
jgi:hypothetical protein